MLNTLPAPDTQYLALLDRIRNEGMDRPDRTGVGSRMLFGQTMRHHLLDGFPILTTKKVAWKTALRELFWFLQGSTTIADLDARIWDAWADSNGNLGPVYGAMFRRFPNPDGTTTDQVAEVERLLKHNPNSRRIIIDAWHPGLLPDEKVEPHENPGQGKMALAPCHMLYQFVSRPATEEERRAFADREGLDVAAAPERALNGLMYVRSNDLPVGAPFNKTELAFLTEMLAAVSNHLPGEVVHSIGDAHIYQNQWPGVLEQMERSPLPRPLLRINRDMATIDAFRLGDLDLDGYAHQGRIEFPVAV